MKTTRLARRRPRIENQPRQGVRIGEKGWPRETKRIASRDTTVPRPRRPSTVRMPSIAVQTLARCPKAESPELVTPSPVAYKIMVFDVRSP